MSDPATWTREEWKQLIAEVEAVQDEERISAVNTLRDINRVTDLARHLYETQMHQITADHPYNFVGWIGLNAYYKEVWANTAQAAIDFLEGQHNGQS